MSLDLGLKGCAESAAYLFHPPEGDLSEDHGALVCILIEKTALLCCSSCVRMVTLISISCVESK